MKIDQAIKDKYNDKHHHILLYLMKSHSFEQ